LFNSISTTSGLSSKSFESSCSALNLDRASGANDETFVFSDIVLQGEPLYRDRTVSVSFERRLLRAQNGLSICRVKEAPRE
jgi:hypothetical protein